MDSQTRYVAVSVVTDRQTDRHTHTHTHTHIHRTTTVTLAHAPRVNNVTVQRKTIFSLETQIAYPSYINKVNKSWLSLTNQWLINEAAIVYCFILSTILMFRNCSISPIPRLLGGSYFNGRKASIKLVLQTNISMPSTNDLPLSDINKVTYSSILEFYFNGNILHCDHI